MKIFDQLESYLLPGLLVSDTGTVLKITKEALKEFKYFEEYEAISSNDLRLELHFTDGHRDQGEGSVLFAESLENIKLLGLGSGEHIISGMFMVACHEGERSNIFVFESAEDFERLPLLSTRKRFVEFKERIMASLNAGVILELRNYLGMIAGYAEMVSESLDVGSINEKDMQELITICSKGQKLLLKISDFSNMDETVLSEIDPEKCLAEIAQIVRMALPKNAHFKFTSKPGKCTIISDPIRLQQIILGICFGLMSGENAIIPCYDVRLSLSYENMRDRGNLGSNLKAYKCIEITVGGMCITDSETQNNYEKSKIAKHIIKMRELIGFLLTVQDQIKELNGNIRLIHNDKNLSISICLPIHEKMFVTKPQYTGPPGGKGQLVLVVDDELSVAIITERRLTKYGYSVVIKTNSKEALRYFSENHQKIDLLITDQVMPEMTGLELATEVLKIRQGMPIIMMTGYSSGVTNEMCGEKGIQFLAMKPLDEKELATIVANALGLNQIH